ncbi:MAG: hypothetical protein M3527_06230, partial [Actinomycetota bacterium]|nr:hypothetical protein [Actinomycetota bacterium]
MANILEFLRGVLTDPEAQEAYRADPEGYATRSGFADLTGEDVVEAIGMLRRSLPKPVADALAPFDDDDELPGARTGIDERDLDAALRMLDFAVGRADGAGAGVDEPSHADDDDDDEPEEHDEPIEVESELDFSPAATGTPPTPLAAVTISIDDLPSVAAFGESLTSIAVEARERFTDVLRQAEQDANTIRSDAHLEAGRMQSEAQADRESARQYLERTKVETDGVLARALQQADDARNQADELMAAVTAESEVTR